MSAERKRLTKTDELMLLGDTIGARKNLLKQARRIRTSCKRTIAILDAAWPRLSEDEKIEQTQLRQEAEATIARCDAMESALLQDMAEGS